MIGEHMYISTKIAGDIAITAAEGGIGYWSQIEVYRPSRWDGQPFTRRAEVFYRLREWNDEADAWTGTKHVVTTDVIQRGVNLLNTGRFGTPFGYDPTEPEYMDADAADMVIQLGLFGKVVYG
jgi:hypothetical protein